MKKILLPTDFSENSWNAIRYAMQLFKNESCTFFLLNTYTPVIYNAEYTLINQLGLVDTVRENSVNNLNSLEKRIKTTFNNPKHTIATIAAFNTLIQEIKDLISDKSIDYIVMGTKGATGAKEVLFGSNTMHVIKNVKCPMLAIPENFSFETPHEILFPTDYGIDYQDQHIYPLLNIITPNNSRINVLNVSYGYELSEIQEKNKHKLETYLKKTAHLFHSVSNQTVPGAIANFQLKTRINLLAMLNNKHSFFENLFFKSTIRQIGFHLNIPFLVIPTKT